MRLQHFEHYSSILVAYQSMLLPLLSSDHRPFPLQLDELGLVNNHLLQLSNYSGQALGRSMAALVVARRQLWLAQARVPDKDKELLLDAPVTPVPGVQAPEQECALSLTASEGRGPQESIFPSYDVESNVLASTLDELGLVNNHLLQLSNYSGQALGRSMAALVVARRQLWLAQARVPDKDKELLLDAPVTPVPGVQAPEQECALSLTASEGRGPQESIFPSYDVESNVLASTVSPSLSEELTSLIRLATMGLQLPSATEDEPKNSIFDSHVLNKQCSVTEMMLKKAYAASAF
ncbi:UNVERIFIED_CONTAM: hypothetical protein FKN15_047636 [Acipenser sinensis]